MALSNVFREPRRELTESFVGIATTAVIVTPPGCLIYQLAVWLQANDSPPVAGFPAYVMLAAVIVLIAGIVTFGFLAATHAIGEAVCNKLARNGMELRPQQRRRR